MVNVMLLLFFFNDTATTEIYTLSLHDALPISHPVSDLLPHCTPWQMLRGRRYHGRSLRSEEHTSELQSRLHLVCRLLLEKKKNITGVFEMGIRLPFLRGMNPHWASSCGILTAP